MPKSTANAAAAAVSNSQTKAAAAVPNNSQAVSSLQATANPQNSAENSINSANSAAQANAQNTTQAKATQADTAQAVSSPQNAAENLVNSAMQTKAAQTTMQTKPPKSTNKNLHNAKVAKKDEFYTQLCDIENELKHYKAHFAGKVVYCNCDDPLASNFFKYFFLNFKHLGLKELITTCYKSQNFREFSKENSPKKAYCIRIHDSQSHSDPAQVSLAELENLLSLSLSENQAQTQETLNSFEKNKHKLQDKTTPLKSDYPNSRQSLFPILEDENAGNAGDFRSRDCIELLKQADIVVTNPPFSLFREYVAQLMETKNDKNENLQFLIIGNKNAITYKEIFKFIKENRLWVGVTPMSVDLLFDTTEAFKQEVLANKKGGSAYKIVDGVIKLRSQSIWFTNLTHKKRKEPLETIWHYTKNPEKYQKYDNYNAINVDKTIEIPMDYEGVMGVPISFLEKHNPEQFEILGQMVTTKIDEFNFGYPYINGKKTYARILIQKRKDSK